MHLKSKIVTPAITTCIMFKTAGNNMRTNSQVLTTVFLKIHVFWDVMLCHLVSSS